MKDTAISGIGLICASGRGLDKFEQALKTQWPAPAVSKEGRKAYRIAPEDLVDRDVLKNAKRADRFSRLAVLAAHDAFKDSGLSAEELKPSGVIIATAYGAHSSIFKFLDGIIDYGELKVSPTTFAHSIHNAAAAYVASALETRGPVLTITQFHFALHHALMLACAWLAEKRVERVLVGTVDECSSPMEYISEEKFSASGKPVVFPGESSIFFLLSSRMNEAKYGVLSDIQTGRECRGWGGTDLSFEAGAEAGLTPGGGLETAAAVLMLKNQVQYASPVFGKIKVLTGKKDGGMGSIQCVSKSCEGESGFIKLSKPQL